MIPITQRRFENIDNKLWVFANTLRDCGLSAKYYSKEKSTGNCKLQFSNHPIDSRYMLVAYETISRDHQNRIKERFGNPYDHVTREPILAMLQHDDEAYSFFLKHSVGEGKTLPIQRVRQYTRAASWLNLLKRVDESRNRLIKDELKINVVAFYNHLDALMTIERNNGKIKDYEGADQLPAKFASSYRRLTERLDKYKQDSYACIIDPAYNNANAAKVNDELSSSTLLEMIAHHNQLDDVAVCMIYNVWAKQNDYKPINPATVGVWRRKNDALVIGEREGGSAYNEKYIREVKGLLPSTPLALVEHDDNNLDFLFKDGDYDFAKYVSIVVMDSRTKLVLGKSYTVGRKPEQWQMYHAYLDAMYYIRFLTGGWHLPFEIKADKWAQKSLEPFYKKIAKYIPPAHGNKHRGYIEQSFGSAMWKRAQKFVSMQAANWTGNNLTAKNLGVNDEQVRKSVAIRPNVGGEAELQIENMFNLLRTMPDFTRKNMNAPSKEQRFLTEWSALHPDDRRPITDEQMLLTFGLKHDPNGRQITITNRGVEPQINNTQYSYDLPEQWMYNKLIGAKVNVIYDPFDMSRVLVTNYDDIRFVAQTAQLSPRAIKDYTTGSREFLNALLSDKKAQVKEVGDASIKRKKIVDPKLYNAAGVVIGGSMVKELKAEAEAEAEKQRFDDSGYQDYLDGNKEINKFFDQ
jgi:hypothetical protein